jgi:hypothetical protein
VVGVSEELTPERAEELVWDAIKEVGLDKLNRHLYFTEDIENVLSRLADAVKHRLGCTRIKVWLQGGESVVNTPPAEIGIDCEIDKPDVEGKFEYRYTLTDFSARYEIEDNRESYEVAMKFGTEGWYPVLMEEEAYITKKEKRRGKR